MAPDPAYSGLRFARSLAADEAVGDQDPVEPGNKSEDKEKYPDDCDGNDVTLFGHSRNVEC